MVSIVIPAYNEENYLPRLLRSIQAQDFPDVEIIVADADSTDRTAAIARSAGARLTRGGVPAVGRNNGARLAKGDYLLFIDADTVIPTYSPRYALAAPNTIPNMMPSTTALMVNSAIDFPGGT